MKGLMLLAWKHACFHWCRSLLLLASISLCLSTPMAIHWMTGDIEQALLQRARDVPFLVGRPGSAIDLVVAGIYFRPQQVGEIPYATLAELEQDQLVQAIPLHLSHTAQEAPIVGTTLDYFQRLHLNLADGSMPVRLGDCLLGAKLARRWQLGPGDYLLSDSDSFLNPAGQLPLKMRITGVLRSAGSIDDEAVFVDVKSCWLMDGIGHGHEDAVRASDAQRLEADSRSVTMGANVQKFTEITPENINTFHFHGDMQTFPLSAILVFPADERSAILWEGRQQQRQDLKTVIPEIIVADLISLLVNLQTVVDIVAALLGLATCLLLGFLISLSLQLRNDELETFQALGAGRSVRFKLITLDLLMILLAALPVTIALALLQILVGKPFLMELLM